MPVDRDRAGLRFLSGGALPVLPSRCRTKDRIAVCQFRSVCFRQSIEAAEHPQERSVRRVFVARFPIPPRISDKPAI